MVPVNKGEGFTFTIKDMFFDFLNLRTRKIIIYQKCVFPQLYTGKPIDIHNLFSVKMFVTK